MRIHFNRLTLPILSAGQVIVVGGSFAGVAAALELAQAGRQVILVEPRTYLGREMTATLRPWLSLPAGMTLERFPRLIRECLETNNAEPVGNEIPLQLKKIKLKLEDLLLAAGVKLIYASLPVGLLIEDETLRGLIIGNKSGRQVLLGGTVIDATETAAVARLAGAAFESDLPERAGFSRTLEFDGVEPLEMRALSVPADLGLLDNEVRLHPGYRGQDHWLVECKMDLAQAAAAQLTEIERAMRREIEARHRTLRVAAHLFSEIPAFTKAYLGIAAYELHGPHTSQLAGRRPEWAAAFDSIRIPLNIEGQAEGTALSGLAGPVRELWCLQEAARLPPDQLPLLRNPVSAGLIGSAFAKGLLENPSQIGAPQSHSSSIPVDSSAAELALEVKEPEGPQRGRRYPQQPVPPSTVPILRTTDVLVVGGGTSGATAAITSAREGMRTVLLELNPGLGGTGTLGGVHSYWFGRRVGFAAHVKHWVEEVQQRLNRPGREQWVIEAKMYALLQAAEHAGVEIFFNAITLGAIVEGNRVRGVVVATRFGPFAVLAEAVIDATGDGDVAAFAGAEYVYGSEREHLVMWYSLGQFVKPGRTRNNFTSMVDVSNIEDYTRAILAGRRRGEDCHDHGIYVATRESRHILGETVLTLTDQLRRRCWPDVVNLHFSNHDIKGKSSADWIRLGLIPPNLEIEIPYRLLLPKGLEGLIVAGKAISATHDALPAIRMQADLENLGGVAALAAAQAVKAGCLPRRINISELQHRLVAEGLLPQEVLTREPDSELREYTLAELEALVAGLDGDRPLYAYSDMTMTEVFREPIPLVEICSAGPRAVPILEQALASAAGPRGVLIAQALALLGSTAGVPTLISEIERHLAGGELPARDSHIRHAGFPPDQGAMPDVAYLIYTLGMARDKRSLAVWQHVADLLNPTAENIRDQYKGVFYYVDAICFGAERLGDPAAIPILKKLHAQDCLRNQVSHNGFQPDFFQERHAMLELALARALARCGDAAGIESLITYLDDNRALLAEQAQSELVAISGRDYGKDSVAWRDWLVGAGESLSPCPV